MRSRATRTACAVAAAIALLLTVTPAAAQDDPVLDYLRVVGSLLGLEVSEGRMSRAEADARLEAGARDFAARGAPSAELLAMRSQLSIAAGQFFGSLERDVSLATSFPGPLPTSVSRALANRLLRTARTKFDEALQRGDDPLPALAQVAKVLAAVRGFTDLPQELDYFADAAVRAKDMARRMPPPAAGGGPGTLAQGPGGMAGPGGVPSPAGYPPGGGYPAPAAQPSGYPPATGYPPSTGYPSPPAAGYPPPGSTGYPPAAGYPAPGAQPPAAYPPATGYPPAPATGYPPPGGYPAPGQVAGGPGGPAPAMPGAGPPAANSPGPGRPASTAAPAAPVAAVQPSDPMLAVLGVGTMEAEALLEGFGWIDVVGRSFPPASDGEPDTEIVLKLAAPGMILDWIEIRSAPDPTEAIWNTRGSSGALPLGLVQRGRLLSDAKGGVSGLQIEDFVVLSLYIQDDGLLERLEQPGTITITYRGGDVATIPIAPLW